jgi:hypothetical protein
MFPDFGKDCDTVFGSGRTASVPNSARLTANGCSARQTLQREPAETTPTLYQANHHSAQAFS